MGVHVDPCSTMGEYLLWNNIPKIEDKKRIYEIMIRNNLCRSPFVDIICVVFDMFVLESSLCYIDKGVGCQNS